MLGSRGIWHEGWFANTVHAATPAGWSHFDTDRWELYHIEADRSQCHDLAAEQPDKLEELKALWFSEAAKYNGLLMGINYGFNKVRFINPVKVGSRIRARAVTTNAELKGNAIDITRNFTVEIDGEDKPALVAEWVTRTVYA